MANYETEELTAFGDEVAPSMDDSRMLSNRRRLEGFKPRTPSRTRNPSDYDSDPFQSQEEDSDVFHGSLPYSFGKSKNVPMNRSLNRSLDRRMSPAFLDEESKMKLASLQIQLSSTENTNHLLTGQVEHLKKKLLDSEETNQEYQRSVDLQTIEIESLKDELAKTQARLNHVEKERGDIKRRWENDTDLWQKERLGSEEKAKTLVSQIVVWKEKAVELEQRIENVSIEHTMEVDELKQRHNAHIIVIDTLKRDRPLYEEAQQQIQELGSQLEFERRWREAQEAGESSESLNYILEEQRVELLSLSDANRILQEELETFRMLVSVRDRANVASAGTSGSATPVDPAWELIQDDKGTPKNRLRQITRRSTSSFSLLSGASNGNTLANELMKTQGNSNQPEIE
ncbi:hypothetical protein HK096_007204, partial [Nowakowskiella sp. JEL0078]